MAIIISSNKKLLAKTPAGRHLMAIIAINMYYVDTPRNVMGINTIRK